MKRILLALYNIIFVPSFYTGLLLASLVNPKIRRGFSGRKKLLKSIETDLSRLEAGDQKIWIHVSSFGEFLQVKPVLQQIKSLNPSTFIFVTFFSPSGYENVIVESPVDYISYLPIDSYFQAKKFISVLSPKLAVIVRHDIWPNFVWCLWQAQIPLILIDASLPDNSSRFWPVLRGINKRLFGIMKAILVVSEDEKEKFKKVVSDHEKIIVAGDTKYDQVIERSQDLKKIALLLNHDYLLKHRIIVAGSSWESDEAVLIPAFSELASEFNDLFLIIAPHEPSENRVAEIKNRLQEYRIPWVRLSELHEEDVNFKCLIVDRIGLLANIYYLATLTFVGGSFHSKIHNVLEPAVYGRPVIFGPKMKNSSEAIHLLKHNAAIRVESKKEFIDVVSDLLNHSERSNQFGLRARKTVMQNVGNSKEMAEFLLKFV